MHMTNLSISPLTADSNLSTSSQFRALSCEEHTKILKIIILMKSLSPNLQQAVHLIPIEKLGPGPRGAASCPGCCETVSLVVPINLNGNHCFQTLGENFSIQKKNSG